LGILEKPIDIKDLGCWSGISKDFTQVIGYTNYGNFFLKNTKINIIAILYTIEPEVVETNFTDIKEFINALSSDKDIEAELLRSSDTSILTSRLGELQDKEVFYPEPYPFLGGSGELETYSKGSVWAFAELVGISQGVGN